MPFVAKRITRDEVYTADEAFFTGTAAEVTPIRELDNRAIGSGRRGPVTEKLQKAFFDVVQGRSEKYRELAHAGGFVETSGGERAPSGKFARGLPVPPAPPGHTINLLQESGALYG